MKIKCMTACSAVLLLMLTACNFPLFRPAAEPTTTADLIATSAAQTVAALSTQLASAEAPTDTPQPSQPPSVTDTSTPPVATPTATKPAPTIPLPTPTPPCDKLGQVEDVTIPDGTEIEGGDTFTKKWKLTNAGTCTWTTSYAIVYTEGDLMDAPTSVALPASVPPNGTVTISVNMKAPTSAGQYQGYWKLKNAAGTKFGWGPAADKSFWVLIKVVNSAFAVISVPTTVDPASWNGPCPKTFTFTANIKTNAAGTVKYHWERSDGTKSAIKTLTFDSAGTKTVTTSWDFGSSGSGWEAVYIDEPNHQLFSKAEFSVTCP